MKVYNDKPADAEFRHLRYEINRTIEFIKHSMLTFLYYSSLLQAGVIGYHEFTDEYHLRWADNILLILVSILIASATMYFIKKFNSDYQYYLYRGERYVDPKFSIDARKYYDKPFVYDEDFCKLCELNDTDNIIEKYFNSSDAPFQQLYLSFNWGTCILVILYLLNSMLSMWYHIEQYLMSFVEDTHISSFNISSISYFIYVILVLGAIYGIINWFNRTNDLKKKNIYRLIKHGKSVQHLNDLEEKSIH